MTETPAPTPSIPLLVSEEPRLGPLIDAVATVEDGAVCTFLGTARRHSDGKVVEELRYEAYPEMAERMLAQVQRRAEQEHPGARVAVQHRIGPCPLGEASVAVAAAAPHRGEAFAACRWAIDTLKAEVPIWKQEVYSDGTAWIGEPGQTPDGSRVPEAGGDPGSSGPRDADRTGS